jgi:hypothetical protein
MFSSGFSIGSAMGGAMGNTQPEFSLTSDSAAMAKRPRQEVKETCLPVTIRAVEVALEQRGESGEDLKFYGTAEPQMILVVAAVESVARQAASLEVTLNDATGRMKGRWFLQEPQEGELERIVPGCYVSAFGEVRASPVQHLALKGMRPVDSADEVSYHVIEVAHAALRLQKSKSGRPAEPATPAPKKDRGNDVAASIPELSPEKQLQPGAPAVVSDPHAAAAAVALPASEKPAEMREAAAAPSAPQVPAGAELRAAVLCLLRGAAIGPEGLHVDVIAQKVGGAGTEVRAVVAELVDDGELYTTITEGDFAAV